MPNYKFGTIYYIECNITKKWYIGSTTNGLATRLRGHLNNAKNGHRASSAIILDGGDYTMNILEPFACETKQELHAQERKHIEANKDKCVNKNMPCRTPREGYLANKEQRIIKQKLYNEVHKDELKAYRIKNKVKLAMQHREYINNNKERIQEYKKILRLNSPLIQCAVCGHKYKKCNETRHLKAVKHIKGTILII